MYISRNYVCFSSPLRAKDIAIQVLDIIHIKKQKTLWIPNAIEIYTNERKCLFSSFVHRDAVFKLLASITNVPTSAVQLLGPRHLGTSTAVHTTNYTHTIDSDGNQSGLYDLGVSDFVCGFVGVSLSGCVYVCVCVCVCVAYNVGTCGSL
jgi:GRAM domain